MFDFTRNQGTISVLLLDGFSTLGLGSILEPLHFFAERYPDVAPNVDLVSARGGEAVSNSGLRIDCKLSLASYSEQISRQKGNQILMICGPTERAPIDAESLLPVLRRARHNSVAIFGVGSVCIHMAHAGMFEGGKCAVHWKSLASFTEANLDVEGANALFLKRNRIASCAGETAVLDLVVNLIAEMSKEASVAVANHFLMSGPRLGGVEQPGSYTHRLRKTPAPLARAVELMARNMEDTINTREIAHLCSVSPRQIERLFRNHLGTTPGKYYRALRLERAQDLLSNTTMSLAEIALASGFSTTSSLSKHFKARYGETPSQLRKQGIENKLSWQLVSA